jgi:hypothetical protein
MRTGIRENRPRASPFRKKGTVKNRALQPAGGNEGGLFPTIPLTVTRIMKPLGGFDGVEAYWRGEPKTAVNHS